MRKIKVSLLVIDYNLYPRNNVDSYNVRCIADAIAAGEKLPPILIDRKSKRIIDGVHRTKAYLTIDENMDVDVIEKDYKSEKEMFLEAMRLNAAHGAKLDACDRTRCCIIAEKLHISIDAVAGALHMTVDKLAGLQATRTAKTSGGLSVPLKRTFQHMSGQRMTKPQMEVNQRSSGMNQAFYAIQLIDMIQANLLDKEDEKLIDTLRKLNELLDELLAAV